MTRLTWFVALTSALGLTAAGGLVGRCLADEGNSPAAKKMPAGLRVAYTLMSNDAEMEAIVKAANIAGHKQANAPYFGTWHGYVGGCRDGISKKSQDLLAARGEFSGCRDNPTRAPAARRRRTRVHRPPSLPERSQR